MPPTQLKEIQHLSPRDRVISATLHLISCEGVDAVTHRKVAAIAGVSPGTTTHHFSDRAELIRESFMAYLQQLDDWMSDQAHDPEVSTIQAVRNGLLS